MVDTTMTSMFEGFRTTVKNELAHKVSDVQLDKILQGKVNKPEMVVVDNRLSIVEKKVEDFGSDDSEDSGSDSDQNAYESQPDSPRVPGLKSVVQPFPITEPFEYSSSRTALDNASNTSSAISSMAAGAILKL